MLYFRKELDKNKYSTYQLNKAIKNKELFKVDKGLYSDVEFVNPLEIISKKYPNAIFTSDSAYYYYDLTDVIPDYFYLATKRSDSRISDKNIKQVFIPNDLFDFGKTQIEVENIRINIYDEERMTLTGEKLNIRYTIGDRVKIKVVAANKQAKTIDFKIIKKM